MTKTTTNLVLMLMTIVGGTYFYITCCSECGTAETINPTRKVDITLELETISKSPLIKSDDLSSNTVDSRDTQEIAFSEKENNTLD
jgi:uncharacterized lipoprotein YajG